MKKRDILLAGGIVLVALVMLLVMHVTGETKGDQVQITVNGEIYGTYPLEKDQTIEVTEGEFHASRMDRHIWKKRTARTATARSRAGSAVRNRPSYVCPINWWWK